MYSSLALRCCAVLLLAAMPPAMLRLHAAETQPGDAAAWVRKLSDDDFDVRAAATAKLAALGEAARQALESAAKSQDVEARMAASRLLALLGRSEVAFHLFDRSGQPAPNVEINLEVYEVNNPNSAGGQQGHHIVTDAAGTAPLVLPHPGQYSVNAHMIKRWGVVEGYSADANGGSVYHQVKLQNQSSPVLVTVTRGGTVRGKLVDKDGHPAKDATLTLYSCAHFNPQLIEPDSTNQNLNMTGIMPSAGSANAGADGVALLETVGDGVYQTVATQSGSAPTIGPLIRVREGQTSEVTALTLLPRPDGKYFFMLKGVPLSAEEQAEASNDGNFKNKRIELERVKVALATFEERLAKLNAAAKAAEEEAAKKSKTTDPKTAAASDPKTAGASEIKRPPTAAPAALIKNVEASIARSRARITALEGELAEITKAAAAAAGSTDKKIDPLKPDFLKKTKLFIDTDLVFEGPEAEQRNRAAALLKMQRNRWNRNPQNETDENGKYELGSLRPGKYRVRIKAEQYAPKTVDLTIAPGAAVNLGEILLDHGGSVSGKAASDKGQSIADLLFYPIREDPLAVAEMPQEVLGYVQGLNTWNEARTYLNWQRQYDGNSRYIDPKNPEKFLLKNLAPGTYSLLIACMSNTRFEQSFLVCGVKVEAGKTTELQPLKFTSNAKASPVAENQLLKGKVTGATSDAYSRGVVYFQYNTGMGNGTSSTSLNSDGGFTLYSGGASTTGKVSVKVPGFKLAEIDCAKPGVDPNNLLMKLEKIRYGTLLVKVLDDDMHPLAGAAINPSGNPQETPNYNYFNRQQPRRTEDTNLQGDAHFNGLSVGSRMIHVTKDGYFHNEPIPVNIQPDAETTVTVTLHKGYSIRGHVLPVPGTTLDAQRTAVTLLNKKDYAPVSVGVDADGAFEFKGLLPDTYKIQADSVQAQSIHDDNIVIDKAPVQDVKLQLQAYGAVALQIDTKYKSHGVALVDKQMQEALLNSSVGSTDAFFGRQRRSISGYVDDQGRIELWGVLPGEYYLMLYNRQQMMGMQYEDDDSDAGFVRKVKCDRYVGPLSITPAASYAAMLQAAALKVDLPESNASATVRLEFAASENIPGVETQMRTYFVYLIGNGCRAQFNPAARSARSVSARGENLKVQVVGEMPPYLKPLEGGKTLLQDLLPGKYKLMTHTSVYVSNTGAQLMSPQQLVLEFEVKPGERKDLGTLKVTPLKETIVQGPQRVMNSGMPALDEDMEEAFEP